MKTIHDKCYFLYTSNVQNIISKIISKKYAKTRLEKALNVRVEKSELNSGGKEQLVKVSE